MILRFADFELDRGAYELRRKGRVVHLERIPLDLLFLLAERRGQMVPRDEIVERIWGKGVFLDSDASINAAIRKIRRALDDDAEAPRFVVTIPAKGYRFSAKVFDEPVASWQKPATQSEELRTASVAPAGRLAWGKFIGRAEEMAALGAAIDASLARRAALVMLVGEPGIGKTRLAEEAGTYARLRGVRVLVGHCYEGEAGSPYSAFVEAIREYVSTRPDDALMADLGDGASDLAKLVPEIRERFSDFTQPPPAAPPSEEQMRLFDGVSSLLINASRVDPIMLVLEDLHWADNASLQLLQHLAHRFKGSRLTVVGTYRNVEVDRSHPLSMMLAELRRERLYERMLLRGLSESQVRELIEAISQQEVSAGLGEAFVRAILHETEGNPFFIEEVLRHLVESGVLHRRAGRWVADAQSIDELGVPEGVRDVVGRRLSRLSEPTNRMLAAAAVLGREFEFELLAPMTGLSEDEMLQAIEQAHTNQMIVETRGQSGPRYAFTHALVRQTLYDDLSLPRRQRLHLQAAQAIESLHARNLEPHMAALANHCRMAGRAADAEKAIDYSIRAGGAACEVHAYSEAKRQLSTALEILQEMPSGPSRNSFELKLRTVMGAVAFYSEGEASADAGKAFARGVKLAAALDDAPLKAESLVNLAYHYLARGELQRASAVSQDLYKLSQKERSPQIAAYADYLKGSVVYDAGEFRSAVQYMTAAAGMTAAAVFEDPPPSFMPPSFMWIRAGAMVRKGLALWHLGFPDQALALMKDGVICGEDLDPYNSACLLHWAAWTPLVCGDLALAENLSRKALNLCTEGGFRELEAGLTIIMGLLSALCGQAQAGLEQVRQSYEILAGNAGREYSLALAYALAEKPDESFATLKRALKEAEQTGLESELAAMHMLKGWLFEGRFDREASEESFRASIGIARRQSAKSLELRATVGLARLLNHTGRRDEARTMLADTYNWFTEGFDTADLKNAKALLDELGT